MHVQYFSYGFQHVSRFIRLKLPIDRSIWWIVHAIHPKRIMYDCVKYASAPQYVVTRNFWRLLWWPVFFSEFFLSKMKNRSEMKSKIRIIYRTGHTIIPLARNVSGACCLCLVLLFSCGRPRFENAIIWIQWSQLRRFSHPDQMPTRITFKNIIIFNIWISRLILWINWVRCNFETNCTKTSFLQD